MCDILNFNDDGTIVSKSLALALLDILGDEYHDRDWVLKLGDGRVEQLVYKRPRAHKVGIVVIIWVRILGRLRS
jgi:hypothetical protein